ncbi:MAG: PaaI family thioesterase [Gammaproteobacteria bacterium]|nr:PaaI family thioesterase [Gammaproteobacteria bacterium]
MKLTIESAVERGKGRLPELFGLEFTRIEQGSAEARVEIRPEFLAPNGYLHAATIIALADTCAGYGTVASLPDGAESFTTIELKSNFLATTRQGAIACVASLSHSGRTTQVWDADVSEEGTNRKLAIFRCTQIIIYPS